MLKDNNSFRRCFSLSKGKPPELTLPEASGKACFVSDFRGVAEDKTMNLMHSFYWNHKTLPSLAQIYHQHPIVNLVKNVVLPSSPSWTSNYITMIIIGFANWMMKHLALDRAGDNTRTMMEKSTLHVLPGKILCTNFF